MRRSHLLVAGGLVAGILYLSVDRSERVVPAPATPDVVAVQPSAELAGIRAEVARLRTQLPASSRAPALPEAEPEPAPDPTHLDELVATEPDDGAWSGDTERAIATVIASDAIGSELIDVTCRTSVCRVEVKHADEPTQLAFLGRVLPSPPFHAAGIARRLSAPDDPSDVRTIVFLARGDQPLPL
jgi:hypothetical protein